MLSGINPTHDQLQVPKRGRYNERRRNATQPIEQASNIVNEDSSESDVPLRLKMHSTGVNTKGKGRDVPPLDEIDEQLQVRSLDAILWA